MPLEEARERIRQAKETNASALDLSRLGLSELPSELWELTSLTMLNLNSNSLTILPPEIGELTNLTILGLIDNIFTTLPPEIGELTNLAGLNLSGNVLTALPPEIGKLTNLEKLWLNYNGLMALPSEIVDLTNLTTLDLNGNPLEKPPLEVARKGIGAIREYFCQLNEGYERSEETTLDERYVKVYSVVQEYWYINRQRCTCGGKFKKESQAVGPGPDGDVDTIFTFCESCGESRVFEFSLSGFGPTHFARTIRLRLKRDTEVGQEEAVDAPRSPMDTTLLFIHELAEQGDRMTLEYLETFLKDARKSIDDG